MPATPISAPTKPSRASSSQTEPDTGGVPLVCDASSDFLHRPLPINKYGLLYACAQKNAGPAGVTVVIIRDDLLARSPDDLPGYLNYQNHVKEDSLYNTPPTFAIYLMKLVLEWLKDEVGGLAKMHAQNKAKGPNPLRRDRRLRRLLSRPRPARTIAR